MAAAVVRRRGSTARGDRGHRPRTSRISRPASPRGARQRRRRGYSPPPRRRVQPVRPSSPRPGSTFDGSGEPLETITRVDARAVASRVLGTRSSQRCRAPPAGGPPRLQVVVGGLNGLRAFPVQRRRAAGVADQLEDRVLVGRAIRVRHGGVRRLGTRRRVGAGIGEVCWLTTRARVSGSRSPVDREVVRSTSPFRSRRGTAGARGFSFGSRQAFWGVHQWRSRGASRDPATATGRGTVHSSRPSRTWPDRGDACRSTFGLASARRRAVPDPHRGQRRRADRGRGAQRARGERAMRSS